MVPEGWKQLHLNDIASKVSDGIHSTPKYVEKSDYYFINGNNLKDGKIVINKTTKCISEEEFQEHKKGLNDRTILMSINGTIGNLAYYRGEKVILGKSAAYITLKNSVNKDFIYFVLSSDRTRRFFESELTGTTIRNLSLKSIKAAKLLAPPLSEQKKIAHILSTWDKAIETVEKLIENSKAQKKALMQQLLTGKRRLPGVDGEWRKTTLGNIAIIDSGFAFKSSDFTQNIDGSASIIRMSDFKEGALNLKDAAKVPSDVTVKLNGYSLIAGDFIFGMSGSLTNYAWVKESDLPCYLNQRVGRLRATKENDQFFVTYLYLSPKVQQSILDKAAGAAQLNISIKDLRNTPVIAPGRKEQQKIASVFTTADKEIETLQQKLDCLKQEKKALMQQLLTGKRRVILNKDS